MATAKAAEGPLFDLGPEDCLAIIAGGGALPVEIARTMREAGKNAIVFRVTGEAYGEEQFSGFRCIDFRLEDAALLAGILKRHKATHLVMAGSIERRPRFRDIRLTFAIVRLVPSLLRTLARGDDAVLRFIVGYLEKSGFSVRGAHELLPELLVERGCLTGKRPTGRDRANMKAAFEAAAAIGALDIGQAAIAIGGRAIALEGIEGTDGLLERVAQLRTHGRLAKAKGGVLAKCAKPGQELRADLPAIGPQTVIDAANAGLSGIALEAGRTLILELQETLRQAAERGIFIVGIDPGVDLR